MNQKDIIRMARETYGPHEFSEAGLIHLGHFASLVAAHEREACAKVCDAELAEFGEFDADIRDVATAIRARGNK